MADINDIIARVQRMRSSLGDTSVPQLVSGVLNSVELFALLDEIERLHMERNRAEREIAGTRADAWAERTARIAAEASLREAVEVLRLFAEEHLDPGPELARETARTFLAKLEKTDG